MSVTNCPHCSNAIPPEFSSMPVCYMCGGDLNAAPSAPVWSSVDIKTDNTRTCPNCNEKVKSVLAMQCPACNAELTAPGQGVADIEKEKANFEAMVTASNQPKAEAPAPAAKTAESPAKSEQKQESRHLKSESNAKPYPQEKKEKDFVSIREKANQKKKEGFFSKLLRMFGLKKD